MAIKLGFLGVPAVLEAFSHYETIWVVVQKEHRFGEHNEGNEHEQGNRAHWSEARRHNVAVSERELIDRLCKQVEHVREILGVAAAAKGTTASLTAHDVKWFRSICYNF